MYAPASHWHGRIKHCAITITGTNQEDTKQTKPILSFESPVDIVIDL